jgi:FKBP-type peptidyl-prolyl cis-trans isomerase
MGILLLRRGSRATFYIPANLGYGVTGIGKTVPPNSPIMYEVELFDILDFDRYDAHMRSLEEKERKMFQEKQARQFQADLKLLESFAQANNISLKKSATGLGYAITKAGKGEPAQKSQRLKVSYEGFLMDGQPIEKPEGPRVYEFILGAGAVLDGWEEGLKHFNKGAEGWLLIPSKLAYGPLGISEGNISIPPDSAIAFKIKVLEILQ